MIRISQAMETSHIQSRRSITREFMLILLVIKTMVAITVMIPAVSAVEHATDQAQTYIVHLQEPETGVLSLEDRKNWYMSFLPTRTAAVEESGESRMMYAYDKVMTGFAARLTKSEVEAMQNIQGFVQAYPDRLLPLLTSYSSQFLGLDLTKGLWPKASFGKGVIVGVLDTGVWPESPSFNDYGIPPVPKRWKGMCQSALDFNSSNCNNKLIGARVFTSGNQASKAANPDDSPRDSDGHGTHTASTAAGSSVCNADLFGNAKGTARGMATASHVAIYKVCGKEDCASSDILAGMDQAIADGVDVLSLSIGSDTTPFFEDTIAIGAFRATEKGIFVSCAAGNSGPDPATLSNDAPWIMTVGASTMDRSFIAKANLGDGKVFYGESLFPGKNMKQKMLPLVYASVGNMNATLCLPGSLDKRLIAGKAVLCDRGLNSRTEKGDVVRQAGGLAMILANDAASGEATTADAHVLPATHVGFNAGVAIKTYINSTKRPTVSIDFQGTVFGTVNAPAVAPFSSRGPSVQSPKILKPDIIAPGVNVLAAWPFDVPPSELPTDDRRVKFNVISGTSMSCPHVSGLAALLKSAHPEWSPAAIKSALMTTADIFDKKGSPIFDGSKKAPADLFAIGAGHVNPEKAADPGLVYDIGIEDYLPYLCSLNYTASQIRVITNRHVDCPKSVGGLFGGLNYPSFSVMSDVTYERTVTNVGQAKSAYSVQISPPKGMEVNVYPSRLVFKQLNEKKTYRVTIVAISSTTSSAPNSYSQGSLEWVSDDYKYTVRSPISVIWN